MSPDTHSTFLIPWLLWFINGAHCIVKHDFDFVPRFVYDC